MARILPRVRSPRYFHFAGRSWSPASIIDLMERFEAELEAAAARDAADRDARTVAVYAALAEGAPRGGFAYARRCFS